MSVPVFISYSRQNRAFAEQLHCDLARAGLSVWRDTVGIPSRSPGWWDNIRHAVAGCSDFLLLASPESARSEIVQQELAEAETAGKPVHRILVGGDYEQLPDAWRVAQVTNFQEDYRGHLGRLLAELRAPRASVSSVFDLLDGPPVTVEAAAGELGQATEFRVSGERFLGLPVEPSGYTMTRLIGRADAELRRAGELAVVLGFSGREGSEVAQEVLDYWSPPPVARWLVWVDGPVNATGQHDLSDPHVWRDAMRASERAVERFGKGRAVHLFFRCPVALGFAVGARLRQMSSYRLYNYQRGADGKAPYELVLPL